MRNERGFALVITLIVTALLVALLVEFMNEVYVDTSHSHNFAASQQASLLAESGVTGAMKLLQMSSLLRQGSKNSAYSSLLEPWAKPQSYDAGVGTVSFTIEEETGKFNLNTATTPNGTRNDQTEMALRLFNKLKIQGAGDLIDTLLDWVDTNDAPHPGGAETNYYRALKVPYQAKNARLETVDELALLKGYTPALVDKLKPYVTVYGSQSDSESATQVNVNTAPREVLCALDTSLTDDKVDSIIDARSKKPIASIGDLNAISGIESISMNFSTKVCYQGSVYRIHSEGKVGESVSVAEAVVRMGGTQPLIVYWREY
ncbi:type II secretion system minor pseudopilin GspK [Geomonas sp. Red32]|uniref:type II secretion system minor pseudopilin GspK n=1 Tax=Geomonas sp. Red32 TaxID=2912856 RepID=UPI00202D075D|nr:type II secretion system minor pseudopilin GspK [Geomonas sp. Red32]MCM0080124.1 type II secretion system minor pseudopilin GspK [Geomonas sp. Red32]